MKYTCSKHFGQHSKEQRTTETYANTEPSARRNTNTPISAVRESQASKQLVSQQHFWESWNKATFDVLTCCGLTMIDTLYPKNIGD